VEETRAAEARLLFGRRRRSARRTDALPGSFTVVSIAAKVGSMTGQADHAYTVRQAAYDLRKLCGKQLIGKPAGRVRGCGVDGPLTHIARRIADRP
jgi:hypothetical protein